MIITLSKGKTSIRFAINTDASYRIWLNNRWSVTYPDFAEKYIALRDAGFNEVQLIIRLWMQGKSLSCIHRCGYEPQIYGYALSSKANGTTETVYDDLVLDARYVGYVNMFI